MNAIGIDVGSLTAKVVLLRDGRPASYVVIRPGDDVDGAVKQAVQEVLARAGLDGPDGSYIVATGIGAKQLTFARESKAITTCLARGINRLFPSVRMLVDIGAETSTVVRLSERGRVTDWGNQDKCAAGTGIFLDQMSRLMQLSFAEMSALYREAKSPADITSTCAVFAESEVISHIHRDPPTPVPDVVAGIFASTVSRLMVICKRLGIQREVAASGGVALISGLVQELGKELGTEIIVPEEPRIVAALGAAILAEEAIQKGQLS
ncbi:MAG: acyl-CoA dehydratase activase [Dehalococcoidales bacterium]|nr:acyl-CoA dehydratase activase [Dehalococcoidales bacterium]